MRKLVLVKHSLPEIVPGTPASNWRLAEAGRQRCGPLAERLSAYAPSIIASSAEPKALETARIVGARLGRPVEVVAGLHEHERDSVAFLSTERFEAEIAALFERPEELVMGRETARQARKRFAQAVVGVVERSAGGDALVVAHGTVITLFVSAAAGIAPFPFWKGLGLPSFVVLELPRFELLEVVEDIERIALCEHTNSRLE